MTDFVVDVSVALKWFVPEVNGDIARQVLISDAMLHAPHFLLIETTNAAWKNWRKQLIDESVVRSIGERLPRLVDTWHSDDDLYDDAVMVVSTPAWH